MRLFNKRFPSGAVALAVSAGILFSGCFIDFSKYGEYRRGWEVAGMFEKGNLPPDYAYYYAPMFERPDAVIGIDPGYALDNDINLWTRADPSRLKDLVDNVQVPSAISLFVYGSYIVSPEGKIIGIYYSRYDGGPIVMGSDNRVKVYLPNKEDEEPWSIFKEMKD